MVHLVVQVLKKEKNLKAQVEQQKTVIEKKPAETNEIRLEFLPGVC